MYKNLYFTRAAGSAVAYSFYFDLSSVFFGVSLQ